MAWTIVHGGGDLLKWNGLEGDLISLPYLMGPNGECSIGEASMGLCLVDSLTIGMQEAFDACHGEERTLVDGRWAFLLYSQRHTNPGVFNRRERRAMRTLSGFELCVVESRSGVVRHSAYVHDFAHGGGWSRLPYMPTDAIGAREFLRNRDAPEHGRRPSLLHWVRDHCRKRRKDDPDASVEVRQHLRGQRTCEYNGLQVRVSESVSDAIRNERRRP